MPATVDRPPEANKLYVGEGVSINGAVLTSGTVVVDGILEGDVSVTNLLVGETGTIKGRITVTENAEIFGHVFERLSVSGLLVLHASCRVDGNVTCGALQIEQGASVRGAIHPIDYRADQQESKFPQASRSANGTSTARPIDLSALASTPSPISASR
jgi:cytoskeletal protein CcmA (bactofilin family)